jgi:hypothetical protein
MLHISWIKVSENVEMEGYLCFVADGDSQSNQVKPDVSFKPVTLLPKPHLTSLWWCSKISSTYHGMLTTIWITYRSWYNLSRYLKYNLTLWNLCFVL